jgi:hypothetical protein
MSILLAPLAFTYLLIAWAARSIHALGRAQ